MASPDPPPPDTDPRAALAFALTYTQAILRGLPKASAWEATADQTGRAAAALSAAIDALPREERP
ncbi:MAG TPA: hypothetical protein VIM73_23215 [Polyangiaceae bacterium]